MIVLGIDPGVAIVGFAVLKKHADKNQRPKVVDFGCITTKKYGAMGKRLEKIHDEVNNLIKKHKPDLISIENLYFFKNHKTAMPVSQARGVILLSAAKKNIPVLEFTPLQVKMTVVGYGRAEKKQVQKMMSQLLDLDHLDLKESSRKKDDAADALGIALCAVLRGFN